MAPQEPLRDINGDARRPKIIAEINGVICCCVIQVRQGVRQDRVFAQKSEGEEGGRSVRKQDLDAVKGSKGIRLDGDRLTVNRRGL